MTSGFHWNRFGPQVSEPLGVVHGLYSWAVDRLFGDLHTTTKNLWENVTTDSRLTPPRRDHDGDGSGKGEAEEEEAE